MFFASRGLQNLLSALVILSSGLGIIAISSPVFADKLLTPTAEQAEGPYYPAAKPADWDNDLTVISGKSGRSKGQVMYIHGRVLDRRGKPVAGALVEIWQTNADGRYIHPSNTNSAPLDQHFQGYGTTTTDSDGRYRFKTVNPGAYAASADRMRPPHVHFMVTSGPVKLTTQLYFSGDPLNTTAEPFLWTNRISPSIF